MVDKQTFLRRYLAWCQAIVADELDSGLATLSRVGHANFGFLVDFLSHKTRSQAADLFSALLHRRLVHEGLEWPGERRACQEEILEVYVSASKQHNNRRMADPMEAVRFAKLKPADPRAIQQKSWATLRTQGWTKIPWNPGTVKCSMQVKDATVATFLTAEGRWFRYSQQVLTSADDIFFETSLADWFGMGPHTVLLEAEKGEEGRLAELIADKCTFFAKELERLL